LAWAGTLDENLVVATDPIELDVHYGRHDGLVSGILTGLSAAGYDVDSLDPAALSGADEFHLGGRLATLAALDSVRSTAPTSVLDVGCGIGGPARTIVTEFGAKTVGVDLTPSFVAAASELTMRVGLADRVSFEVGDALALDQPDEGFDLVTLFHVGMNIADKHGLFAELARVLRPAGHVLVYDIMRIAPGELTLPVPWASSDDHQHLADVDDYLGAMRAAGLEPGEPVDRRPIVRTALADAAEAPPPVDLSNLMGPDFAEMFTNLRAAVATGVVAPMQIVASKTG
jgi:SAM-dependent methyltransferase